MSARAASSRTRARNSGRAISPRGRLRRSKLPRTPPGVGATERTSTGRSAGGSPGTAKCCLAASAWTSMPWPRSPRRRPRAVRPGAPPSGSGGCVRTTSTRTVSSWHSPPAGAVEWGHERAPPPRRRAVRLASPARPRRPPRRVARLGGGSRGAADRPRHPGRGAGRGRRGSRTSERGRRPGSALLRRRRPRRTRPSARLLGARAPASASARGRAGADGRPRPPRCRALRRSARHHPPRTLADAAKPRGFSAGRAGGAPRTGRRDPRREPRRPAGAGRSRDGCRGPPRSGLAAAHLLWEHRQAGRLPPLSQGRPQAAAGGQVQPRPGRGRAVRAGRAGRPSGRRNRRHRRAPRPVAARALRGGRSAGVARDRGGGDQADESAAGASHAPGEARGDRGGCAVAGAGRAGDGGAAGSPRRGAKPARAGGGFRLGRAGGFARARARARHFVELLLGRARGSPVLFRWVRELVSALELPPEAVGPLVTASWLDRGRLSLTERRRAEALGRTSLEPAFAERAALAWVREPGLGPGWSAWA